MRYGDYSASGGRSTSTNVESSKHDSDCMRRKAELQWQYICTCGLSDDQVRNFGRGAA
jgi:hypothetical protein